MWWALPEASGFFTLPFSVLVLGFCIFFDDSEVVSSKERCCPCSPGLCSSLATSASAPLIPGTRTRARRISAPLCPPAQSELCRTMQQGPFTQCQFEIPVISFWPVTWPPYCLWLRAPKAAAFPAASKAYYWCYEWVQPSVTDLSYLSSELFRLEKCIIPIVYWLCHSRIWFDTLF